MGSALSILLGETRSRLLGWLLLHPDESFYLRELVRTTGSGHGAVQRELETLTRAGLVTRRAAGRQVYFQANRDALEYPDLRSLMTKSFGIVDTLREALLPYESKITAAFVFGSAARGELQPDSDIDLLIVGDLDFATVIEALAGAQQRLGREINPTLYPTDEFTRRMNQGHHFISSLQTAQKQYLIGGDHDLGRLAAKWLGAPTSDKPRRSRRAAQGNRTRLGR